MNVKLLFRISTLLILLAFTVAAGTVSTGFFVPSVTSYTSNWTGITNLPTPSGLPMDQVGGNIPNDSTQPSGAVDASAIETFLGMSVGSIRALINPFVATTDVVGTGSAVKYTSLSAATSSDLFSFMVDFISNDHGAYNDFAFYTVSYNGGAPTPTLFAFTTDPGSVCTGFDEVTGALTPLGCQDPRAVGDFGQSGWQKVTVGGAAGTYDVGFGVINVGDNLHSDPADPTTPLTQNMYDSVLLIETPEPATLMFVGSALVLAGLRLRRRAR